MSFRSLSPFTRGLGVTSDTAKQDRIQLLVGNWYFTGDDNDLTTLLGEVANTSLTLDNGSEETIFQAPQRRQRSGSVEFRRSGRRSLPNMPLVSGSLRATRGETDDFSASPYTLWFDISINPTRALRHQLYSAQAFETDEPRLPPFRFFTTTLRQPSRDEVCLDGRDNVILSQRNYTMARPPQWQAYRDTYFLHLDHWLDTVLMTAHTRSAFASRLTRRPRFNLKEVETYWEFRTEDAVRLSYDLVPCFHALGTASNYREFQFEVGETEFIAHSARSNCIVRHGVNLKAYAKTNRRVRFELTHNLRETYPQVGAHEVSSTEAVIELIERVADDATFEFNRLLPALEQALPSTIEQSPVYELVRLILNAAPDEESQRQLLSIIINGNGIRLAEGDPMRTSVTSLERAGVLVRSRRSSRYFRLAEHFSEARRVLANSFEPEQND